MIETVSKQSAPALNRIYNLMRRAPNLLKGDPRPVSYDMLFKDPRECCARFDDVWGG